MQHAITVGMGFGKHDFHDGVLSSHAGDVVVIEPGEYWAENGFEVTDLTIKGLGNSPSEVVIHTNFSVKQNVTLKLENLTLVNEAQDKNACWIPKGSQLIAKKVVFTSNAEQKYPVVFFRGGTGGLTACEVRHNKPEGTGLYVMDGGSILLSQSDIAIMYVVGARAESRASQIRTYLGIDNNAEFVSDNLYFADPYTGWFLLSVTKQSILSTQGFYLPEGQVTGRVENGRVVAPDNNIDQLHALTFKVDGTYELDVPGAEVIKLQPVTSTGEVAEEEQEQESESETEVEIDDTGESEQEEEEIPAIDQLHAMIGLTELKKQVDAFIKVAVFNKKREEQGAKTSAQSLHSLFLGNPGTGKTTVARLVAKVMYENGVIPSSNYVEVSRQDLVSQNVGGTAIQTQKILDSALGGVLFIDEAYTLYEKGGTINWGQEAIDTILKYMEDHRDDLMIIFAGYTKEMQDFINMNPGLASRTPNSFNFEDYTPDEIAQIGILGLKNQDYKFDEEYYAKAVKEQFAATIDNSNGRWVRNFNEKLIQTFVMNFDEDSDADIFTIPNSVIDELTGGNKDSKDQQVDAILEELNGMIGLANVKKFVNDLVARIKVEQKLKDKLPDGDKPTYHMVFAGDPGTGKTTVARIIAKLFYNLGILPKDTVSEVSRPDLIGPYIGHTEEKTSKVIRDAMGGVLFVDEAYQLTQLNNSNDFGKEAVETFITELENNRDKFVAIFAGYTADMDRFLEANPGLRSRVPLTIEFDSYSPEEVAEIVKAIITKNWTVNEPLLQSIVVKKYKELPDNEKSNGRWARNFATDLISRHKLSLGEIADNPDVDIKHISDDLLFESI